MSLTNFEVIYETLESTGEMKLMMKFYLCSTWKSRLFLGEETVTLTSDVKIDPNSSNSHKTNKNFTDKPAISLKFEIYFLKFYEN